jgi:putative tryptophan/tyrosine transport system substrate-binding protein
VNRRALITGLKSASCHSSGVTKLRVSRRVVIAALGGAVPALTGVATAQPSKSTIGFLVLPARLPPSESYFAAFEQALTEAGFKPGSGGVTIEYRYANNRTDRLPALAQELVITGANVIVTPSGLPAVQAARKIAPQTSTVAIFTSDPVQLGLIASLNKPGGNLTGVIVPGVEVLEKQLELARELLPGPAKVGVLADAVFTQPVQDRIDAAAAKLGLGLITAVVGNETEIDAAFVSFAQAGVHCVVIPWTPLLLTRHEQIVALAGASRLPDIYAPSDALSRGGLMSYGSAFPDMWRLLGTQTAKILAGAKPSELPVEFPARIELRVNLKVARERGIAIPPAILTRADEVIE